MQNLTQMNLMVYINELENFIKTILNKYSDIHILDNKEILEYFEIVDIPKNKTIKYHNSTENSIRLILSGIGGYFILNKEREEKCIYFNFKNEIFFDYTSFFYKEKTDIILKTITDTKMLILHKQEYDNLCKIYPELYKSQELGLKLLYEDTLKKYIELLTLKASERYKLLIKKRQDIIRQIDNKYIASYLGITPQSLSRLKRNI